MRDHVKVMLKGTRTSKCDQPVARRGFISTYVEVKKKKKLRIHWEQTKGNSTTQHGKFLVAKKNSNRFKSKSLQGMKGGGGGGQAKKKIFVVIDLK